MSAPTNPSGPGPAPGAAGPDGATGERPLPGYLPGFVAALLVALAAVSQALGIALAVGPTRTVPSAVALVLMGAALGAGGLLGWSSPRGRRPALADALLVLGFALFVPALGLPGLALVLGLRARGGPRAAGTEMVETAAPRLPGSPLHTDERARFGPGSLEGILRHGKDPEARLRVVLACRQLPGRLAVPLLRLALRDPVDDVRLLAYAVLDSKERQIQKQIQAAQGRLSQARGAARLGHHARLAELYWELVYQGLVEGELLSFSLEQALQHAAEVLRASPASPRLALLSGRALLLRQRPGEAQAMLADALRRGLPAAVVEPYLAEAAYLERKPEEVRRHLAAVAHSARLRPGLAVITERWQ